MASVSRYLRIFCGCHCRADRSFFFKGRQFPVCARCTGVLAGYVLGIVWAVLFGRWHILICLAACLPALIDGIGQQRKKWESTNLRRLFTGIPMGMATVSVFINLHFFYLWQARKILNLLS
ncbi:MAG: hypothetical protein BWY37_00551 [Firmicutes bacterium ADurb.Bin262]|nr:MAG: hypothetical protein BWY37_00551 [Firmicutes bacterium ADurb.Bin262]